MKKENYKGKSLDPEEVFKTLCKTNENIITKGQVMSLAFLIGKNLNVIPLTFTNAREKEVFRELFKQIVAKSGCKAYVLIFDSRMTVINKNTGVTEVKDCIVRELDTPKGSKVSMVIYKDKKILEIKDNEEGKYRSEWNIWNDVADFGKDEIDKYQKYKKEHPEDYKDCQ